MWPMCLKFDGAEMSDLSILPPDFFFLVVFAFGLLDAYLWRILILVFNALASSSLLSAKPIMHLSPGNEWK
jgi:hypothetical protein